jgi:NADH dehydrogenase
MRRTTPKLGNERKRKGVTEAPTTIQPTAVPHVVIVGVGFGGLRAVKALKDEPVRVTVIDRYNHHVFQPLLYQVATGALSPADIATPIRAMLRRQKNAQVILADVTAVDLDAREVVLDDSRLGYDYLILAAGAREAYFGHDEWKEIAPGLKTLDDALLIRRRIFLAFESAERETDPAKQRALLTFVVVGGGPTGVEMAGAIGEIAHYALQKDFRSIDPDSARIYLIEAGPRILATFPEHLARKAHGFLGSLGVEVRTGRPVTAVEPGAVLVGEERIQAGTIIWSAGVTASPLAHTLGVPLDRAGRVLVQPDLTVPGHPEVFVIGDLMALNDEQGRPLPGVAQVAMQQGGSAAKNILRTIAGEPRVPFHYRDYGTMATIGRNRAIAAVGPIELAGFPAWVAWIFLHIAYLIGFRNRIVVLIQWLWAYATFQRGARLITGNGKTARR